MKTPYDTPLSENPIEMKNSGSPAETQPTTRSLEGERVREARVDIVFRNMPVNFVAAVLTGGLTLFFLWNVVSHAVLVSWFCSLQTIGLIRLGMFRKYRKEAPDTRNYRKWENRYTMGATMSGVAWGSVALFLFRGEALIYLVFISFILGGMVTGAVGTNAVLMKAFLGFSIPVVFPMSIQFFLAGGPLYAAMGSLTLIFLGAMVLSAWKVRGIIEASIKTGFENTSMVERIKFEKERTDYLNAVLRRTNLQNELILKSSEEGICGMDQDGRLTFINPAGEKLVGWNAGEIIGRKLHAFLFHSRGKGEERQSGGSRVYAALQDGTVHEGRGEVFSRKDGSTFPAAYSSSPVLEEGRVTGAVLVFRDITDRVRLEERLERNKRLTALGEIVSGVSHEVRNPLFSISATIDAFEARFGRQEEFKKYLVVFRTATQRLRVLMEDLLDFGRPAKMDFKPALLSHVVQKTIAGCEVLCRARKVHVSFPPPGNPVEVEVDSNRMAQVFQNLIENAVQHSPPGGQVSVELEEIIRDELPWAECRIRDAGEGFSSEDLDRVFEPFYSRRRGGTGLGVSIARRFVEEHAGWISASNHPEGGGLIRVQIPLKQPEEGKNE